MSMMIGLAISIVKRYTNGAGAGGGGGGGGSGSLDTAIQYSLWWVNNGD